ncbi:TIGR03364 family FAD-dependent oxidoreductase [Arthrobacter sp. D3-18]
MIPLPGAANVSGVNNPSTSSKAANSSPSQPVDVVIVGAGIVGLAHSAHAVANGLTVTIIERDHHAAGASVRNFGHCCITAQSGELYELAQTSRKYWLEFAQRAGFWAAEAGAVVLARTEAEMKVLRELSAVREPGQVELLSPAGTRARLAGSVSTAEEAHDDGGTSGGEWPGLVGGAFLRDDLRVDPRTTVAKLAEWLSQQPGVELHWNTAALGFNQNADGVTVQTSRGDLRGRQVFVCVGHDVDYLFPDLAEEHRIQRCALQMSLAAKPTGVEFAPAVLTATSMLRYPAFTDMPAAAALHSEVLEKQPELLEIGANVMFTQRPDGTIILGDSHHYHRTADPFLDESVTDTLNSEITGRIGEPLEIIQRWQGIYASSDVAPILVRDVQPGVTVVSVTSGVGMTLSFGLAHRNVSRRLH